MLILHMGMYGNINNKKGYPIKRYPYKKFHHELLVWQCVKL